MLIGDVLVGAGCYIGPSACLRGDCGRIDVRAGANLQDCCVMHGFPATDTVVEEEGHIGHGAILHGCVVQKNALVGMNAVVNDNAVIGESAIVAAMAFVKAGMVVPPRTLWLRRPRQGVRTLTDQESWRGRSRARRAIRARARSLATMVETVALMRSSPIENASSCRSCCRVDDEGEALVAGPQANPGLEQQFRTAPGFAAAQPGY